MLVVIVHADDGTGESECFSEGDEDGWVNDSFRIDVERAHHHDDAANDG